MASHSINICSPLTRKASSPKLNPVFSKSSFVGEHHRKEPPKIVLKRSKLVCSATQESSTATVPPDSKAAESAKSDPSAIQESSTATDSKEAEPAKAAAGGAAATPAAKAAPAKPKKAPAKPFPDMMADEVETLKATLEAQEDLSDIELSFKDDTLEGFFLKNGVPYCFWAFFPNGTFTGPKGFSLSSYGGQPSTVEPFLIDEKNIKPKQVAFWITKRLAAQGLLPQPPGESK